MTIDNKILLDEQFLQLSLVWPKVLARFGLQPDTPSPETGEEMEGLVAKGLGEDRSIKALGHDVNGQGLLRLNLLDPTSCFSGTWRVLNDFAARSERMIADGVVPPSGSILGVTFTEVSVQFGASAKVWRFQGYYRSSGSRFLSFMVSGCDSEEEHRITFITLTSVDTTDSNANVFADNYAYIRNTDNAEFVWEYSSSIAR